ncbi:Diverse 7TM receptor, extracellular region 2 [Magnetococcus marinus MC-1]|uniref:histidine kinase n=1 Tax=Magnetococcus marinus (strain ATCC BAA-1437 / JCM 17883 / MC-1) TaxID=156889 RepID=A0LD57_MAGMM|nr:7TM diverse intracellular signaling domain-containing protein [Magnetococcus marinus]ABK45900.1 Diverse 7TM receptor, extracellular region 2 [Magnetococcus marinus MC-1]
MARTAAHLLYGLFVLVSLLLSPTAVCAHERFYDATHNSPILLMRETQRQSLQGHFQLLPAQATPLTIEQVIKPQITQQFLNINWGFAGGFQSGERWLRVNLEREPDAPSRWIIELGSALLDRLELYIPTPTPGHYQRVVLGDHTPLNQRPMASRLYSVPLDLGSAPQTTLYLRLQTLQMMTLFGTIWQEQAFMENERQDNLIYGMHLGIFLLLIGVNLLAGIWLRDPVLRIYALYLVGLILIQANTANLFFLLLPITWPWFNDFVLIFALHIMTIAVILLWDHLLELKRYLPTMHKLYHVLVIGVALVMPFGLTQQVIYFSPHIMNLAFYVFALSSFLTLIIAYRRQSYGLYLLYFIAFLPTAVGGYIYRMMQEGTIPHNFWTEHAFQLGSLSHLILFTLVLGYRVQCMQQDQRRAQEALLRDIQSTELELERHVKRRAMELEAASASLESTHQQRMVAVHMERRIRRRQRTFLSLLSHEFRQPLSGIFRAVEMIRFKQPNLDSTTQAELLSIAQESKQLGIWVDTLLTEHARLNQEEDEEEEALLWDDEDDSPLMDTKP